MKKFRPSIRKVENGKKGVTIKGKQGLNHA